MSAIRTPDDDPTAHAMRSEIARAPRSLLIIPSASSLDRADACPASCSQGGLDVEGEFAAAGTAMAQFIERARVEGREAALEASPEEDRDFFATIDLDSIPPGMESEVALGFSIEDGTAVRYDLSGHRRYPNDGRIHMTLDLVGVSDFGRPVIWELKRFEPAYEVRESLQVAAQSVTAAALVGADGSQSAMVQVGFNGSFYPEPAFFDREDLDAMHDRIADVIRRVKEADALRATGVQPPLYPGPRQCRYCPALADHCPAVAEMRNELAGLAQVKPRHLPIAAWIDSLSDDEAGALAGKAEIVANQADVLIKAVKERVLRDRREIPLGDGTVYRIGKKSTQSKSPVAKAELAALKGDLVVRGEIIGESGEQVRIGPAHRKKKAARVGARRSGWTRRGGQ